MRARLHLLLRTANPRISRLFRRRGFRKSDSRERARAGAPRSGTLVAEMEAAASHDERRNRLLSADRAQDAAHPSLSGSTGEVSKPCRTSNEEPADYARYRCAEGTRCAQ